MHSLEGQVIPIITNRSEWEKSSNRRARGQIQPPLPKCSHLLPWPCPLPQYMKREPQDGEPGREAHVPHLDAVGSLTTTAAHRTSLNTLICMELLTGSKMPVYSFSRRVIKSIAAHILTYGKISIFGTGRPPGATCRNASAVCRAIISRARNRACAHNPPSKTAK